MSIKTKKLLKFLKLIQLIDYWKNIRKYTKIETYLFLLKK